MKNLTLFFALLFGISLSVFAQTGSKTTSDKTDNQTSLDGLTEAILVDNKPTMRVLSRKKGGVAEVKLLKRGDDDSLVFDVVKSSAKNPVGKLFVTKDKVIFEPMEEGQSSFDIEKSKVKKISLKKTVDGFPSLKIEFNQEEAKIVVKFDRYQYLIDRKSQNAINDFLYLAITDFDSAVTEFNKRTESVRDKK